MKAFCYALMLSLLIIPHIIVGQDFDKKLAGYKGNGLLGKIAIFFVLTWLPITSVVAQDKTAMENLKGTRSLEVFVGPSLVFNHGSEEFDEYGKAKLAYHFGLNVRHPISKHFAISTSIGFYRKGYRQESTAFFPPDIFNNPPTNDLPPEKVTTVSVLNNDYVALHVLPEFNIIKNRLITSIGGFVARNIRAVLKREDFLRGSVVRTRESNRLDNHESLDYGLSLRLGHQFNITNLKAVKIFLGADYSLPSYITTGPVGINESKNLAYHLTISTKLL